MDDNRLLESAKYVELGVELERMYTRAYNKGVNDTLGGMVIGVAMCGVTYGAIKLIEHITASKRKVDRDKSDIKED